MFHAEVEAPQPPHALTSTPRPEPYHSYSITALSERDRFGEKMKRISWGWSGVCCSPQTPSKDHTVTQRRASCPHQAQYIRDTFTRVQRLTHIYMYRETHTSWHVHTEEIVFVWKSTHNTTSRLTEAWELNKDGKFTLLFRHLHSKLE